MSTLIAGQKAPDFLLKSIAQEEYSLISVLKRGPVLATFFKVSCPVCQFTAPFLERLFKRYGGDNVSVIGISQDDAQASKEFADEYRLTFPILIDASPYTVSCSYGLTNVPSIFLIETDGVIKISSMGFIKNDLEDMARNLSAVRQITSAPLFLSTESVPAHRPG